MKKSNTILWAGILTGMLAVWPAFGQSPAETSAAPPPSAPVQRSVTELERLAAPIALHPDPLISIILPAAVYPVEIVQAARFVRDTNNLSKIDEQSWDENVKAVAKFPELIAKMDDDLGWTVELGQAFVEQPKELMDMIQTLRAKAQKAGTLRTTDQQIITVTNTVTEQTVQQQVVYVTNTTVEIYPANPEIVYVPTYPVTVYYPPPTYVYDPYAPWVVFGAGIAVGAIIANNCDWHSGGIYVGHHGVVAWGGSGHYHNDVDVDIDRNTTINRGDRPANPGTRPTPQKWQADQSRLRSSGAGGASAAAGTREARGWNSTTPRATTQPAAANRSATPYATGARPASPGGAGRPATGAVGVPSTGNVGNRPATRTPYSNPGAARPAAPANTARPAPAPSVNRSAPSQGTAFNGVNNGSSARNYSNRGSTSRSSGGFGGGRSGGRSGGGRR